MKRFKRILWLVLAVAAAGLVVFMLMAHGDEQVSGVALSDTPVNDISVLDAINSSKGSSLSGFDGVLYTTTCVQFGKYVETKIAPVPKSKALYVNILFIASPKGMQYKAVWKKDGTVLKDETKAISATTNKEAVSYMLEESSVLEGAYTLEIYYKDKLLYSQNIDVI